MNTKKLYKGIGFFFCMLLLMFCVNISDSHAASYSAGDLIKTPERTTVYYYGFDNKRWVFPNESTYFSWYNNFDSVKTISSSEMEKLSIGGNIVIRPGTYLVKITTSPKVYAVGPQGLLREIRSEEEARFMYGDKWANRVIDIPDPFFVNYNVGNPLLLERTVHPTGTVFKFKGDDDIYVLTNGYARKLAQTELFNQYRFFNQFMLELPIVDFHYDIGDQLTSYENALGDTAQTLFSQELDQWIDYVPKDLTGDNRGNGLSADYYRGENFNELVKSRVDPQVNFDWGWAGPFPETGDNFFSARWQGEIQIDEGREYTFYTYSSDGVRLKIDGQMVIDNWTVHSEQWDSGRITLSKGRHDIELEYYELGFESVIKLGWNKQGEIIPSDVLFPN